MKLPALYFIFIVGISSSTPGICQQALKLNRSLPATIEIPPTYSHVYSNKDGSLSAYESLGSIVYRIYLSGHSGDFIIPTASNELEMKQKINDLLHSSSSLLEWDERQIITRDDRKIKMFSTEYLIFPKGNREEYKSLDLTLYDGEFKYEVSLEYDINVYQHQVTPLINSILESFIPSGNSIGEKIQLIKKGGVYKIPVTINESATANFIFDTGASSILLSKEFLKRMMLENLISEDNFIRYSSFIDANGDTTECKLYLLKTVKVGNRIVKDVKCAVADIGEEEMLLGQSFLEKLGTFHMNYYTNCLEFK